MPDMRRWVWGSMKPGSSTRSAYRSSIVWGWRRSHGVIESSVPTDTIRPPATAAIAPARSADPPSAEAEPWGRPGSMVWTRAAV